MAGEPDGGRVEPGAPGDRGVFLLIVIAVPIACLLLVLLLVCIAILLCNRRRRRRRKPASADVTSSSTFDSSTGSGGGGGGGGYAAPRGGYAAGNGAIPYAFSSPLSEQTFASMNMYDEAIVPSAPLPPLPAAFSSPPATRYHPGAWNHASDPLPLQSTLALNVYDQHLSY